MNKCKIHYNYTGRYRPKTNCSPCLRIWQENRNEYPSLNKKDVVFNKAADKLNKHFKEIWTIEPK